MSYSMPIKKKVLTVSLIVMVIGVTIGLQEFGNTDVASDHVLLAAESDPPLPSLLNEGNEALTATNCRYGVGFVPEDYPSAAWIPTLKAGWFVNFSPYEYPEPNSEFIYTIRLRQVIGAGGVRLPEYTVNPRVTDYYEEGGGIHPGLGYYLGRDPGATWVVGNEIDIDNHLQDNIMPDIYAAAYHEIYHYIKSVDPTAKVAIGSVLQATPGRLQYLDIVLDTYRSLYGTMMPVDIWNIHLYIIPERTMRVEPQYADGKIALGTDPSLAIFSTGNPAHCPAPDLPDIPENDPRLDVYCRSEHDSLRIFSEQVYALRAWMKQRGQQNKPLIITEYGSLRPFTGILADGTCQGGLDEFGNCFPPPRVSRYLWNTTDFMENAVDVSLGYPEDGYRLVQRWSWYSIFTSHLIANSSNLLVRNYDRDYPPGAVEALSLIGRTYLSQAEGYAKSNLIAEHAASTSAFVEYPDHLGTATLTASFRNNGTYSVVDPFTVTFYSDAALTNPIGSVEIDPTDTGPVMGCSWVEDAETVGVAWSDLPVGTHYYWAKIDSGQVIGESNEADNVTARGRVDIYAQSDYNYTSYVPVSRRN